jgi:hypothetical protein
MSTFNRRDFSIAAATLATGICASAAAQGQNKPTPDDAERLHRETLDRARVFTKGQPAATEAGLHGLVEQLLERQLISREDAAVLHDLIKELHAAKESVDEIVQAINRAIERKADELTSTIVRIARGSLNWAREKIRNISPRKLRYVIAHDMSGALQGAAAGAAVGALVAAVGAPAGAIVGAIIGSSATSLIAADDFEDKK